MKLSVCMIVKNEEYTLERCLKNVVKFADEIIIVDTGSTDNTVNLAKKYTDKVYFFNWNNDFSAARNFSFAKATGDYLMWLDADDVISKSNIKKIQQLKNNLIADTYMLKYQIAFDSNNSPTFEYYRERIVKNCANAKFSGFIHEAISPFGKIIYENIAIEHRKINKTVDGKRNLKIYRFQIKNDNKFNSREMFYYARELFFNGYYKKTILTLKKYLKMPDKFLPNVIDAYILISDCYLICQDQSNSKKYLIKSFEISPPNALICCRLGSLLIKQNDYNSAIFWYKTALNCKKNEKSGEFIENDYYDFIPLLQLSFCFYQIGDTENFLKYHYLAKQIKPYDSAILHNQNFIDKI